MKTYKAIEKQYTAEEMAESLVYLKSTVPARIYLMFYCPN